MTSIGTTAADLVLEALRTLAAIRALSLNGHRIRVIDRHGPRSERVGKGSEIVPSPFYAALNRRIISSSPRFLSRSVIEENPR